MRRWAAIDPGPVSPAGVRLPTLVQNVDVAPTVLELLAIEQPPEMTGRSLIEG